MYLSVEQSDKARNIIAHFEIAYRSYIAENIITAHESNDKFYCAISDKISVLNSSNVIFSSYLKKRAINIKNKHKEVYSDLEFSLSCYLKKDVVSKHDVADISEIVGLTYLFTECFDVLIKGFSKNSEFVHYSDMFHDKRNKLSHIGSDLISEDDMFTVMCFISTACDAIDESYFWYVKKKEIVDEINEYLDINVKTSIHTNRIPFVNNRILCREEQLSFITDFVEGKEEYLRKSNSLCIYGYGGLGKTALILEYIGRFIKKIQDGVSEYIPDFILFFSAKDMKLITNEQTGRIQKLEIKKGFSSFDELKEIIFDSLNIKDFKNFKETGLIVIDNFESLSQEDRNKVIELIKYKSPDTIQYILTSRNPEKLEESLSLKEFDLKIGTKFVKEYIREMNFDVELSDDDIEALISLSRGNTLVIVLSLHRLNTNKATLNILESEFSAKINFSKIKGELTRIPANAFEIISEFMYRNTFDELKAIYPSEYVPFQRLLKVFAVIDNQIEIYTLSSLLEMNFLEVERLLEILCNYLIIERNGEYYSVNQFANKFIVDQFISDSVELHELTEYIERSKRKIEQDLGELNRQMAINDELRKVISDWDISLFGDKICAAKAYNLYGEIIHSFSRSETMRYIITEDVERSFDHLYVTTVHPYIRFQRARVYETLRSNGYATPEQIDMENQCFLETIQTIKWNYPRVNNTKSYGAVLWFYGMFLSAEHMDNALKYFEDAIQVFELVNTIDDNYYSCMISLALECCNKYDNTKKPEYLIRAKAIYKKLSDDYYKYAGALSSYKRVLNQRISKYDT